MFCEGSPSCFRQLYRNRHGYIANMSKAGDKDTVGMIVEAIEGAAKGS